MTDAPPPAWIQPFARAPLAPQAASRRCSVYAEARRQADVYKWVESERANRDLGEEALKAWARRHWRPFVRACWLQHLRGERYWAEVDRGDFGLLAGTAATGLVAEVVALLRDGGENLDVILWARQA